MSEPSVITEPAPEAETTSRWEDYIDVFFSPVELFQRRAGDRVAPPLITLLLLAVAAYFAMLPANGIIMRATVAQNPDAAQAIGQFGTLLQVIGGIFVPVTYLFVVASAALLLWVVGRFADIRTDFSRTMLIATYAAFVYLLAQIAGGVAVILHGEAGLDIIRHVSFGPLRLVGSTDMNPILLGVLRRFELFTLWQTVLWGIGIAVVYRASRTQAAVTAGVTWLLLALPGVLAAMLGFGVPRAG